MKLPTTQQDDYRGNDDWNNNVSNSIGITQQGKVAWGAAAGRSIPSPRIMATTTSFLTSNNPQTSPPIRLTQLPHTPQMPSQLAFGSVHSACSAVSTPPTRFSTLDSKNSEQSYSNVFAGHRPNQDLLQYSTQFDTFDNTITANSSLNSTFDSLQGSSYPSIDNRLQGTLNEHTPSSVSRISTNNGNSHIYPLHLQIPGVFSFSHVRPSSTPPPPLMQEPTPPLSYSSTAVPSISPLSSSSNLLSSSVVLPTNNSGYIESASTAFSQSTSIPFSSSTMLSSAPQDAIQSSGLLLLGKASTNVDTEDTSGKSHGIKKQISSRKKATCEICNKEFGRKSDLERHKASVHDKLKPFKCEICGRRMARMDSYLKHMRIENKNKAK